MGRCRHLNEGSETTGARFVSFYKHRNGALPTQIAQIEGRKKATETRYRRKVVEVEVIVGEEPPPSKKPRALQRSKSATYRVFRECLLRHLKRESRTGHAIRQDITDDYGTHTERRFWRVIAHLMEERIIEKTVDGYRLRAGGGT